MKGNKNNLIVIIAIALYCIVFCTITILKYTQFGYNGLDLAIINQVFFTTAHGAPFSSSIHPPSYLGDHVTPIVLLLAPLYGIFDSPIFLLIIQTIALAAAAWPLFLIAQKILPKKLHIIPSLVWLVNPFVHNINLFEFHFLALLPLVIFFLVYYYKEKKFLPYCTFLVAALLIREDVFLILIAIAIIALIEKRSIKWWLTPCALGIGWFAIALSISKIFSVTGAYKFLLYYAWAGNSTSEIIKTIITQPWLLIPKIISIGSIVVVFALLMPIAFTALRRPKYLLLSAPNFIQLTTGTNWQWLTMILFTQYSAMLLPGVFIAGIHGVSTIIERLKNSKHKKHLPLAGLLASTSVVYGSVMLGPLPQVATQLSITEESKSQWQLIESIPDNAHVASGYSTLAPLSSRHQTASLQYVFLNGLQFLGSDYSLPSSTEYLVVNDNDLLTYQLQFKNNSIYQDRYNQSRSGWNQIIEQFNLKKRVGNLSLYQKNYQPELTFISFKEPSDQVLQKINEISITSISKKSSDLVLSWQATETLKHDYFLEISTDKTKRYIHLSYGNIPYEKWPIDKAVEITYTLTEEEKSNSINISLVHNIKGGIELDTKRSITDFIDSQQKYPIVME